MGTYIRVGSEVVLVTGPYGRGDGTSPDSPLPGEIVAREIASSLERQGLADKNPFVIRPRDLSELSDALGHGRLSSAGFSAEAPRVEPIDEAVAAVAQAFGGEPVSGEDVAAERRKVRASRTGLAWRRRVGAEPARRQHEPRWVQVLGDLVVAEIGVEEVESELNALVAAAGPRAGAFSPLDESDASVAERAFAAGRSAGALAARDEFAARVKAAVLEATASMTHDGAVITHADVLADRVFNLLVPVSQQPPAEGEFVERKPRKRVDAIRWTGANFAEVEAWLKVRVDAVKLDPEDPNRVIAWDEDGRMKCLGGDWFVQRGDGSILSLADDKFRRLYAPAAGAESDFAAALALGMVDPIGESRPRLLDDAERTDIFDALTTAASFRSPAQHHQLPAERYDQLRAALDRVSASTWRQAPTMLPEIDVARMAFREELLKWRRWASTLVKEGVLLGISDPEHDEVLRKKIAAVLEAPAVIAVDEVARDLRAAPHRQLPPETKHDPLIVEACARVANDAYREMFNGDDVPPRWDDASDAHKEVARETAASVLSGTSPMQYHARWRDRMRADGWMYGPEKDPVLKTHPNIRPYGELHSGARALDALFTVAVQATRRAIREYQGAAATQVIHIPGGVSAEQFAEFKKKWTDALSSGPSVIATSLGSPEPTEGAAGGWVNDPFRILDKVGEEMGRLTPDRLRELFEDHCECRPVNTARASHSHDCDTAITDDVRTLLHHAVEPGDDEETRGELRPATMQEEILARDRLAAFVAAKAVQ